MIRSILRRHNQGRLYKACCQFLTFSISETEHVIQNLKMDNTVASKFFFIQPKQKYIAKSIFVSFHGKNKCEKNVVETPRKLTNY